MTNATTENVFLIFGHFDRPPPTLGKKNEFWNFYLKFLQILEFQMWIFGRKFGRSAKNVGKKYSSILYFDQKNFDFNTSITKVSNVKTVVRSAAAVLRLAALRPEVKPQLLWKNPHSEEKLENKSN